MRYLAVVAGYINCHTFITELSLLPQVATIHRSRGKCSVSRRSGFCTMDYSICAGPAKGNIHFIICQRRLAVPRRSPRRTVRTWRNAWQYAINVDYPNRVPLYDVYGDVEVDMHLTGCVGQRKGYVLNKSFRIVDKKGVENPDLTAVFESSWFKTFMDLALDSIYWGHSLIQLGDIIVVDGVPVFSNVLLVPRLLYADGAGSCGTDHW